MGSQMSVGRTFNRPIQLRLRLAYTRLIFWNIQSRNKSRVRLAKDSGEKNLSLGSLEPTITLLFSRSLTGEVINRIRRGLRYLAVRTQLP